MSFFEPLPAPPPESVPRWSPPAWDRPSEGTLPAIVPVEEIVHRRDDVVVELDHVRVYPNGFTINLSILVNPHLGRTRTSYLTGGGPRLDPSRRFPRVGVRFADGRTAGRQAIFGGGHVDIAKDEAGIPTSPVLMWSGGGGGSSGYHFSVWVFPLPPDGPLEVYVSLPADDGPESKVVLDGAVVRAAAERAKVIWS